MSASRERKERAKLSMAQPERQVSKQKKKLSEGWILAISVILVVVVVFGSVLGIRAYQRNQTVLTVGDKNLTVREFNYYYNQTVSNYSGYASYFGIDTAKALNKQNVHADAVSMMGYFGMDVSALDAYKQEDGSYDITWAGYFAELAKENAVQTYAIYQAAKAAGFDASEKVNEGINGELSNLMLYASINGYSDEKYLEMIFGQGSTMDTYKEYLTVTYTASEYISQLEYDVADVDARYEESPEEFDVASYYLYSITVPTEEETEEGEEASEETTEEATEEAAEEAEEEVDPETAAKEMEANFDVENEKVSAKVDQTRENITDAISEEAATWMFEAKPGDVKLFFNEETKTYYVAKLIMNENYNTLSALQIFISNEEISHEGHDHGEEDVPESEMAPADSLAAVLAGLEADGSEESFRKLAETHNDSETLEMTDTSYAYINGNISTEAMLWCMEDRAAGEFTTFETEAGTYVLYMLERSDSYRYLRVNSTMVTEWLEEITDAAMATCGFDMDSAMNGAVGIIIGTNNNSNNISIG